MIATPETLIEFKPDLENAGLESAPAVEAGRKDESSPEAVNDTLYLIGRPTLKQFLKFVKGQAVDPPATGSLTDEWLAAKKEASLLEEAEAGVANNPRIQKMGPEYEPLLIEFLKDPLVRHGFNTVPTEVAIIELDSLIVYQHHIDLTFVRDLIAKLGPVLSKERIFRTCLPYDHPEPPVKWSRVGRNRFVFVSPSNDLRFLGAMPMKPKHITDYPPPGALACVIGLGVGFGSNFLNAIYTENRLILNNGSHRAYALREMGYTHVPCIVQHVSSRDELELIAASAIWDDPDYYLKHPRPSMFKDYFNPKLHKVMPVHRRVRQITVRFEVEESYMPAM